MTHGLCERKLVGPHLGEPIRSKFKKLEYKLIPIKDDIEILMTECDKYFDKLVDRFKSSSELYDYFKVNKEEQEIRKFEMENYITLIRRYLKIVGANLHKKCPNYNSDIAILNKEYKYAYKALSMTLTRIKTLYLAVRCLDMYEFATWIYDVDSALYKENYYDYFKY